jgi:thiamine biosynthesis lipoprotein
VVDLLEDTLVASTRAMASNVRVKVARRSESEATTMLMERSLDVFHEVHEVCTRFSDDSALMRANATPARWHRVPRVLFRALREAHDAYQRSGGVFDPRVLDDLVRLGYDSTLHFDAAQVRTSASHGEFAPRDEWRPRFRATSRSVWLGDAVDLGGIGKGLAVRWASELLASGLRDFLVEAGGDCYLAGVGPDLEPWRVGVEDPRGAESPVAVLAVRDRAVATSSVRLRHWRAGEQEVHHLIDPRTRRSGGEGLMAVTVVAHDPAWAEVDAKVLFLEGIDNIERAADAAGVAALWCDEGGSVHTSAAMIPYVLWERP